MTAEIGTPRLILRAPLLADAPALFGFLGDPVAMRHTQLDGSLRECRRRIAAHENRRRCDGYAPWTVLCRADCRIIGWGGLYVDPLISGWGPEIGYHFHPSCWRRGYATELVAACIALADHQLMLPELRAFAHAENAVSRRVLEKAGFVLLRFVPTMDRFLYRRGRGPSLAESSVQ